MIVRTIAQRASTVPCIASQSIARATSKSCSFATFHRAFHQSCSRKTIPLRFKPLQISRSTFRSHAAPTRVRFSSSEATPSVSPVAAEPTASTTTTPTIEPLTWNRFLEIRKVRRQINVVASVLGVGCAFGGSLYLVKTQDVDVIAQKYLSWDPLITMGIVVLGIVAAGWLVGPVFGNAIFKLRYRALRQPILEKEKELFQRISKHRVDPTRSSYQNPVPDYYGEKIGSVRDYRRWLKDQRAFNLKRAG